MYILELSCVIFNIVFASATLAGLKGVHILCGSEHFRFFKGGLGFDFHLFGKKKAYIYVGSLSSAN